MPDVCTVLLPILPVAIVTIVRRRLARLYRRRNVFLSPSAAPSRRSSGVVTLIPIAVVMPVSTAVVMIV
ncbi:hypothetical protein FRC08_009180 [Ceratobasidium sp. 394]|nr:hypothetical protein FRC08_009180 [Ceratobasidium sp. 394]